MMKLLRPLLFVLLASIVAAVITPLVENPGHVHVVWLGYAVEGSALVFVIAGCLALLLLQIIVLGLIWLFNLPARHAMYRRQKQHLLTLENVGLLIRAINKGEKGRIRKYWNRARRQLPTDSSAYQELEKASDKLLKK